MRRSVVVLIAVLMLICLAACAHADGVMPSVSFALYSPSRTGPALHTDFRSGLQPLIVKAAGSPMMPALSTRAFKCPEPSGVVSLFCGVACIASLVYRKRR